MLAVTLLVLGSLLVAHIAGMIVMMLTWSLENYVMGAVGGFMVSFFLGGWFFGVG